MEGFVNNGLDWLIKPELTDGVIYLRPLDREDADAHLAGEDDEIARWLSGGHSTPMNVQTYMEEGRENWRNSGPRRALGIFDCASDQLIGSMEANLAHILEPGQINVSYGVFRQWRGRGIAGRALDLMGEYLRTATDVSQMVLRIAPANTASVKVAEKAGFTAIGVFDEPGGALRRFVRKVK